MLTSSNASHSSTGPYKPFRASSNDCPLLFFPTSRYINLADLDAIFSTPCQVVLKMTDWSSAILIGGFHVLSVA